MRMLALLSVVALAAHSAPEARQTTLIVDASGQRLEMSTRFHAPERRGFTVNDAAIEVFVPPPEPDRGGVIVLPEPERWSIEGTAFSAPGEIDPCWMPALLLLAKGYVTPAQVFDRLGLEGEITLARGAGARRQDRATDETVLSFLVAQVKAMRPDRVARVEQLLGDAGFPPGPCVPPRG